MDFIKHWIFGIPSASPSGVFCLFIERSQKAHNMHIKAPQQQQQHKADEDVLEDPAELIDNPLLCYYEGSSNRGVVVFALQVCYWYLDVHVDLIRFMQDVPVNKPLISEHGTRIVRSQPDEVSVGGRWSNV